MQAQVAATLIGLFVVLALLEVHQRADGSVAIPQALQPYMMGCEVIEPRR